MLGLETPAAVKGAVFGLSSSAQSFAAGGGALLGGVVAAGVGTSGALITLACGAVSASIVVSRWGREPPPSG